MTYRINKTDGTVLTDVINGTIDQITTDITLIGSDVSGYGELINENFIKILENFCNSELPPNPITGQLWYDTSEEIMKVYNGIEFVKVAGAITTDNNTNVISKPGDIIVDTVKRQVFVNTGAGQSLIGPAYSSGAALVGTSSDNQGISGFKIASIKQGTAYVTVSQLWNSNDIVGFISSKNVSLTSSMYTYTGQIKPGLTLVNPNNATEEFNLYLDKVAFFRDGTDSGASIRLGRSSTFTAPGYLGYSDENDTDIVIDTPTDINVKGSAIKLVGTPTAVTDAMSLDIGKIRISRSVAGITQAVAKTTLAAELAVLAPVNEYVTGMQATVLCYGNGTSYVLKFQIISNAWTWVSTTNV